MLTNRNERSQNKSDVATFGRKGGNVSLEHPEKEIFEATVDSIEKSREIKSQH